MQNDIKIFIFLCVSELPSINFLSSCLLIILKLYLYKIPFKSSIIWLILLLEFRFKLIELNRISPNIFYNNLYLKLFADNHL